MENELLKPARTPRKKRNRPEAPWCVLIAGENLIVVGGYRPLAIELLKQIVPGGARKFYRTAGSEFFSQFSLSPSQVGWLQEARLFNGAWEVLREYRRSLLNTLALEYPQVWLVEGGQHRLYNPPLIEKEPATLEKALGAPITMPLSWARSHALYCHRHRTWEVQPCKEAGVIVEKEPVAKAGEDKPRKKKWPDLELHAPANTLVRASRKQVSYYLAAPGEPIRIGRDEEGETQAGRAIEEQRLALVLRAGRAMTLNIPPQEAD